MRDEAQPALGDDLGIEHFERAGRRVAGVGEGNFTSGAAQLIEPDQLGIGHVHLAAHFEERRGAMLERERDFADGSQVRGDVVAALAVAAGRAENHDSVFVAQRYRDAVDFELDDIADFLAGIEPFAHPDIPFLDLVVGIRVVDRKHGHGVADRFESFERLAADALGGAIGRDRFGMLGLELRQLGHHPVEFAVADFGLGQGVVEIVVPVELGPEMSNFALDLLACHGR